MERDFLLKDTEINRMLMKEINNGAEKKKRVKKKDKKEKTEKVGMLSRNEEVLEAEKVTSSYGETDLGEGDKEDEEAVTQACDSISGEVSRNEEVVEGGRGTSSFGETALCDGDKDALDRCCPAVGNCGDGNEEGEIDLGEEMVVGGGVNLEKYVHEQAGKVSATVKARSRAPGVQKEKRKRSRKSGQKSFMSSSESEDDLKSPTEALGEQTGEVQALHSFRGSGESVHPSPNVSVAEGGPVIHVPGLLETVLKNFQSSKASIPLVDKPEEPVEENVIVDEQVEVREVVDEQVEVMEVVEEQVEVREVVEEQVEEGEVMEEGTEAGVTVAASQENVMVDEQMREVVEEQVEEREVMEEGSQGTEAGVTFAASQNLVTGSGETQVETLFDVNFLKS